MLSTERISTIKIQSTSLQIDNYVNQSEPKGWFIESWINESEPTEVIGGI